MYHHAVLLSLLLIFQADHTAGDPLPDGAVLRLGTARLRPGGSVAHIAFSPDGTKLAAWSRVWYVNDSFSLWDVKTGRLLRRVDLPGAKVLALTWLADGRGIAILQPGYFGTVVRPPLVWEFTDDKATPRIPMRPTGAIGGAVPPGPVGEHDSCYAISPDGKTLAIGRSVKGGKSLPILLRPLKTGVDVTDLPAAKELAQQPGNCAQLLFTPDGRKLVAFNEAKEIARRQREDTQLVVVWDAATGKEVARFTAPRPAENWTPAVAVSNQSLAIGTEAGGLSLWDLSTGKERKVATGHVGKKHGGGSGTFAVAFTSDTKNLVTGGADGLVKLWDVGNGKPLCTLGQHYTWVEVLATSPDGRTFASGGQTGLIRLWDTATGKDACPQPGHLFSVSQVALSPDGRTAVTGSWDHTLRWWDTATGRESRKLDLPGMVGGLAISPDGRTALATVDEERLRMWDMATGRETMTPDLLGGKKAGKLTFTPDGRRLITASGPHVTILDWPTMKVARAIELPKPVKAPGENQCQSVSVSSDGRWLVTAARRYWIREEKGLQFSYAADGVVDLWDLETGKRVRRLAEAEGSFSSATFTVDGRVVLVGGNGGIIPAEGGRPAEPFQGEINLFDPIAARLVRPFAPTESPRGVTTRFTITTLLSPDGRTLYVAYNTGEIIAYEVATGQPRRTLAGHREHVLALGIRRDGQRLISGGHGAASLVWDVTLAGAARPRQKPLTAADAEALWTKAADRDARTAFAAVADLATAPDRTVEMMRRHLKPVSAGPSDADLDRIFAGLDSDVFATRENAMQELTRHGETAVPGVRKRLERATSLEVRLRARRFLKEFDPPELSPMRLQQLRAIELLEGIATASAKTLLAELAKGAAGAPLTLDATAALARLDRR